MGQLIMAFWSVARLRLGPQDMPHSLLLLTLTLGAHWAVGTAIGLVTLSPGRALTSALAGTLIMAALVHGILSVRQLARRTPQALTALAGAEVLLGLAVLPASLWYTAAAEALPAWMVLLVVGWNAAVAGHVFRCALDINRGAGLLVGVGYILASFLVADLLLPPVE